MTTDSSIYGPIVGAFVITLVSELMIDLGPARFLIISAMIILVLLVYPGGIIVGLRRIYDQALRLRPARS